MRVCAVLLAFIFPLLAADVPLDILEAAKRGKTREIEALLAKGSDLEARDKQGRTPLMLAAQYGRTASVRLLLEKGAKADARDSNRWNAYMLALLSPSGGMIHTVHNSVLKLLPQPKRFRLAVVASWTPGKALYSSCFMPPPHLTQHMREIHPDGIVVEALQRYAAASGRDFLAIVSADARGNTEISERPTPTDVDAVLTLQVEPGITCVQDVDQLSMQVQATLSAPGKPAPLFERTFGAGGIKTGMRGETASNPNQHVPLYQSWAKSQVDSLYWAVLTALLLD